MRLPPMEQSTRRMERALQPDMGEWARVDSMPRKGTQPKSKAPCSPLVEQAAKQRKMAEGMRDDHEGADESE